jgi:NAD(P)-dependent dehydrogenase (short-subunit alcohol dehydrogenase family)
MEQLEGRTAVVTGAASGIGLAVAGALVGEGMRVVMADLDGEAVRARAERLRDRADAHVEAVQLDVCDPDAVAALADSIAERFEGLHVVVNNAGIVNGGLSWELSLDEWRRVIDVDLWGVIHGIRSFVPLVLAAGEGHVVNTASMASVLPHARLGPYVVAKHGVLGLSDVLRAEFAAIGAPIGVSVLMPGMVRTAMNPIGTLEPDVVAVKVVAAIRQNHPYVFTDAQGTHPVRDRLDSIVAAKLAEGS